jgi:cyclin-dependent kinase 9
LNLIVHLCGSITPEIWPNVESLDLYSTMEIIKGQKRKVKERLRSFVKDTNALDLLDKLLTLDPNKRVNADAALGHDFFWLDPMPQDLENMLKQHTQSMFEYYTPPRRPRAHQQPHPPPHPHPHHPGHHPRHPHPPPHGRGATQPQPSDGYHERVF